VVSVEAVACMNKPYRRSGAKRTYAVLAYMARRSALIARRRRAVGLAAGVGSAEAAVTAVNVEAQRGKRVAGANENLLADAPNRSASTKGVALRQRAKRAAGERTEMLNCTLFSKGNVSTRAANREKGGAVPRLVNVRAGMPQVCARQN